MSEKEIKVEDSSQTEAKTQARQDYEAGQEFLKNSDTSQAANAFHNALIGFEQDGDENGVANASDKLADLCAEKGAIEKALEHLERAYTICNKNFDRFSLFSLEKKKAKLIRQKGDLDQAIELYLAVLDEFTALRDPQGSVDTLETLADIYIEKDDKEKAADAYRMAASIHKSFKHPAQVEELLAKAAELEK